MTDTLGPQLLVQILAGFVLGASFMVALQHLRSYLGTSVFQAASRVWHRQRPLPRRGSRILPLHVWAVAFSYDLLLLSLMTRDFDWRAFLYMPALALGGLAMFAMLAHQRNTQRNSGHPSETEGDEG